MINRESDILVSRLGRFAAHTLDHFGLRTGGNTGLLRGLEVEQVNEPDQFAIGLGDRKRWRAQRVHLRADLRDRIFWAARGRVWSHRGADPPLIRTLIRMLIWAQAFSDTHCDEVDLLRLGDAAFAPKQFGMDSSTRPRPLRAQSPTSVIGPQRLPTNHPRTACGAFEPSFSGFAPISHGSADKRQTSRKPLAVVYRKKACDLKQSEQPSLLVP